MFRYSALVGLISMLLLSGCSYFRLPILQGNIVDYDKAEQVELGMTPRQVEFLLGTPLIRDSFGAKRWDYVVYYRNPEATVLQKNLSIYFEGDAVSRIEGRDALLEDWRKKKAVLKKAKDILETPHPGQFPAESSGVKTNAQPSTQPTAQSPSQAETTSPSDPAAPTAASPDKTEPPQPRPAEPMQEPGSQSTAQEYPRDMTTNY